MPSLFADPAGITLISNSEPDWPIYEYTREGANAAYNRFETVDAPSVTTFVSSASDASGPAFWQSLGQARGLYTGLVLARDGKMYSPPFVEAGNVLVVDPSNNTTSVQSFGVSGYIYNGYNFSTGALAPNGKIYCPPWNINPEHVLVIDPTNSTSYTISMSSRGGYDGGTVYSTAVLASNNKIYCLGRKDCMIINTNNDTVSFTNFGGVVPDFGAGNSEDRWASGVRCLADDKLYFVSRYVNYVIVIDPATNTASRKDFGSAAMTTTKQTYIGIANSKGGKLTLVPWDRPINPNQDQPRTRSHIWTYVNPVANTSVDSNAISLGASVTSRGAVSGDDGGVYSIPWTRSTPADTARFRYNRTGDAGDEVYSNLSLNYGTVGDNAEWWGGCLAPNGKIYSLPYMSYWSTSRNEDLRKSILVLDTGGNAIETMGNTNFRTLIDTSYFNKGGT